jgi:hypothetical protein
MAKTIRSLKPGEALLQGRLRVLNAAHLKGEPSLGLDAYCPFCRRDHQHGWVDDAGRFPGATIDHRVAHCDGDKGSPLDGYWIGLDPHSVVANKATYARYRLLHAEWEARMLKAQRPSVECYKPDDFTLDLNVRSG